MTLQSPAVGVRSEVSWMSPARGLWVATRRGEYAGMVERLDGAYHARSARGRDLGLFGELDAACGVIDGGRIDGGTVDGSNGDAEKDSRRLTTLLWVINVAAAVVAVGLTYALLR